MKSIIPIKYKNITEECGTAGNRDMMVKIPFPFHMYLNGDKKAVCKNFYGNKLIAFAVVDALQEILDIFGIDFIRKNGLDNYGGCFEFRPVRGGTRQSDHSWGMAIDYLPHLGKLGSPSLIPYQVVNAFKKRGFLWCGDWVRKDGMHFTGVDS